MSRAEGTFDIDRFDTQPPHDDREGVTLARAHITKTFHGDLAGNSETDIITVHTEHPAAYVGMERFEGTLHGRKGGFVLQHNAGGANAVWTNDASGSSRVDFACQQGGPSAYDSKTIKGCYVAKG